jgi:dolichol-phosphate mannosyltransferase
MISRALAHSPVVAAGPGPAEVPLHLSLIAPVHNEAECISQFVAEASRALTCLHRSFELIIVDDDSTDDTWPRLLAGRRVHPGLRILRLGERKGQSGALAAGIRAARGRFIALIDADLQNDPADIEKMLTLLENDPHIGAVAGWRMSRRDSVLRRLSSRLANWISGWLTGDHTHDAGCGLKVARGEFLRALPSFRGMHRFFTPLIEMSGGRVVEMPVNHRPRPAGVSKYGGGLGRTFTALHDALGVRWLRRRHVSIATLASEPHCEAGHVRTE